MCMTKIRNSKTDKKLEIIDGLHKYHNELVSLSEKYIKNEIDIVEYVYLVHNVNKSIKFLESAYYEDNE